MAKKKDESTGFKTHIKEPRWQQIVSVVLAIILFLAWWGWLIFGHKR